MDPHIENKADFDETVIAINGMLRMLRGACLAASETQPLEHFAFAAGPLISKLDHPKTRVSRQIRRYARLIDRIADDIDACEYRHLGQQCYVGKMALQQLVLPVMLSISCVAAGIELARGKDMILEEHDA